MADEHLYIVTYDIGDSRRWRAVFRLMQGAGEWLQLSVFQCRLSRRRHAELVQALSDVLKHDEDHLLIIDLGAADGLRPKIQSIGKSSFTPVERAPVIV